MPYTVGVCCATAVFCWMLWFSTRHPLQFNALDLWVLTRNVVGDHQGQCDRRIRRDIVSVGLLIQELLRILHCTMVNYPVRMCLFCFLRVCQTLLLLLFVLAVVVLPRFCCWSKECFVLVTISILFCAVGGGCRCYRQCCCRCARHRCCCARALASAVMLPLFRLVVMLCVDEGVIVMCTPSPFLNPFTISRQASLLSAIFLSVSHSKFGASSSTSPCSRSW